MNWYIAHVIMWVRFKDGNQDHYPVWENIFLIKADNDDAAMENARAAGKDDEEQRDESFTWDKRPAEWVFGGVRKLMFIDGPLVSLTELTYNQFQLKTWEDVAALIQGDPVQLTYEE